MTDQEKIGGKRKVVRRNGTENFIDGAIKQRKKMATFLRRIGKTQVKYFGYIIIRFLVNSHGAYRE